MSIFITDSIDIDFEDRLYTIISTNRLDNEIYRYTKYTNDLSAIKCILIKLLNDMVIIIFSDITDKKADNIPDITFGNLITKLELLNIKIYILSYHFCQMHIIELVNNIFHTCDIDIKYIYKILIDEILNNHNMTSLKYLNYIFNNINSKEKQCKYFNKYIHNELCNYIDKIDNYHDICNLLDNIYHDTSDKFSNLLFNCLSIQIQKNIDYDNIYVYLVDNTIWRWMTINTNINEKICSKFINYYKLENNNILYNIELLDHTYNIHNFLTYKNTSKIIIKHLLEENDIIEQYIQINDKQLLLTDKIISKFNNIVITDMNKQLNCLLLNIDGSIYENIEPLIYLCSLSFNIKNNELFQTLYIKYFKERIQYSTNTNQLKYEKIAIKLFESHLNNDFIKILNKYIYDIDFNKELNDEYKQQLIMKGIILNSSENLKITTYSPKLWDNIFNDKVIIDTKNNIDNILGTYIYYYQKYYEYKFNNIRKLNVYGNIGNIKFNLIEEDITIEINCNPIQFIIINFIINNNPSQLINNNIVYDEIKKSLNIFSKDLDIELDILVQNKIIYIKNENYYITDIKKMNLTYDLTQHVNISKSDKDIINKINSNIIKAAIVFKLKRDKIIDKDKLYIDIKDQLKNRLHLNKNKYISILENIIHLEYCKMTNNELEYMN